VIFRGQDLKTFEYLQLDLIKVIPVTMADKKLNKLALAQNHIVYDINPVDDKARQDLRNAHLHASIVTDGLLDFEYILSPSCFVSLGCKVLFTFWLGKLQDQLSEENKKEVDDEFESSKIPAQSRESTKRMYDDRYHIARHDRRFARAESIAASAKKYT
jgi:hypothetical protein